MNIKKRRLGKWLLLAVLLYCLLTAVILQFTDSHLILYFCHIHTDLGFNCLIRQECLLKICGDRGVF